MDPKEFDEIFQRYESIKKERVDDQLNFYTGKVFHKRFFAQWSGVLVLIISLAIPVILRFNVDQTLNICITIMSLFIALMSGLDGLHQWRTTWREYSKAIVQIKTQIALWKIKVANAQGLSDRDELSKALGDATAELITNVEHITSAEMDTFFSARSAVQQAAEIRMTGKEA
jgi:hypothetical protein